MGAAASVNGTDWDSLDVPVSELTAEIKALSKQAEDLKQEIAQDDFYQLKKALTKKFKPHTEIIKRITGRTKSQIQRLTTMGEGVVLKDVFQLSEKYGNFLKCCHKPHSEVSAVMVKTACSGIGCDHSILINVICSSTPAELITLDKDLAAVPGLDSLSKVALGNAKDHLLKKFFEFALADLNRVDSPEYVANNGIVKEEAAKLQGYFTEKNDANNTEILRILTNATRLHTGQIAEAYLAATGVELEEAVGDYFSPSSLVARSLISWISPVAHSVARMLFEFGNKVSYNSQAFELIYGCLSRHDKPMLAAIAKRYEIIATAGADPNPTIDGLIYKSMGGKLAQAVSLWCSLENQTPDQGTEEELVQYLATKAFHDGTDCEVDVSQIANLVKDVTTAAAIKEILEREVNFLQNYRKGIAKQEETREWGETEEEVETELTPEQESAFIDSKALLGAYFKMLFTYYDKDHSGLLDSTEFWRMVDEINLTEFGFADDEIMNMKEVSDWDNDGQGIAYDEVIHELSTHIYKSCVKQGLNVEELMKKRIEAHAATVKADEEAERDGTVGTGGAQGEDDQPAVDVDPGDIRENKLHAGPVKMPPHIETWIHETFNAYDVDKSGELDIDEFLKCVSAMNLGTTEQDLERIRLSMDSDGDKLITWAEAIEPFTDIILSMVSDRRDHWIGLVDKESGFLFWYNLKDGNSIWMNAEDQEAYKAAKITAPSEKTQREASSKSKAAIQQAIALNSVNNKCMYEDDDHQEKLAKLRASEAKANDLLRDSLGTKQDMQKKALAERLAKRKKNAGLAF